MLGSLALPDLLANKALAAGLVAGAVRGASLSAGGPPHIEFFDPKMTAPKEIRSITGEVKTNIPGITFGGTFPKLAKMTDKFSVVRSYGSKNGHTYHPVTWRAIRCRPDERALWAGGGTIIQTPACRATRWCLRGD